MAYTQDTIFRYVGNRLDYRDTLDTGTCISTISSNVMFKPLDVYLCEKNFEKAVEKVVEERIFNKLLLLEEVI